MALSSARSLQLGTGVLTFLWLLNGLIGLSGCASASSVPARSEPPVASEAVKAETIQYSYATGCYEAYQRICGRLSTDEKRGVCRQDGLENCEKSAQGFRDWIKGGKR